MAAVISDGRSDYLYIDSSAYYRREYYYMLTVAGERVKASAQPSSGYIPALPNAPMNLVAEHLGGSTVNLTWDAPTGGGPVQGYRIYRALYEPTASCNANNHEYVGAVGATSFQDVSAPHGVYVSYRVAAYNAEGISPVSAEADGSTTTDVAHMDEDAGSLTPDRVEISVTGAVSPNPSFEFWTVLSGHVVITIHDVRGRLVREVVSLSLPPGRHVASWSGRTSDGRFASSGIYFARLHTGGGQVASARFLLIR